MSVLFIENHDSFSFNLIDYLKRLGAEVLIRDHLEEPNLDNVSHLVLGPGPGNPKNSGQLLNWLKQGIEANIPILGICLGHQAIGEYFGANLARAPKAIHGEVHKIFHTGQRLFKDIPNPTYVTRYHSLALKQLPDILQLDAWTEDEQVMAISHIHKPIYGLQFHPESFLSQNGIDILCRFIKLS